MEGTGYLRFVAGVLAFGILLLLISCNDRMYVFWGPFENNSNISDVSYLSAIISEHKNSDKVKGKSENAANEDLILKYFPLEGTVNKSKNSLEDILLEFNKLDSHGGDSNGGVVYDKYRKDALQCDITVDSLKFDCHPEEGTTKEKCEARGCCYKPVVSKSRVKSPQTRENPMGVPWCYYPSDYQGYSVQKTSTLPYGLRAEITRTSKSYYPSDAMDLVVEVMYEADTWVRFRVCLCISQSSYWFFLTLTC